MKKLILAPFLWLIHKLRYYIYLEVENYKYDKITTDNEQLLKGIRLKGSDISWPLEEMYISVPIMVSLGSSIQFGPGIYLQSDGGIKIGSNCRFGEQVRILSTEVGKDENHRPVRIGQHVVVGNHATILPGTVIGDHTCIAAGCTVSGSIPPHNRVGFPAEAAKAEQVAASPPATNEGEGLIFVASTGRSGSTTIAKTLNQHPDILALHEPKGELIRIAAEYEHGVKSRTEVKAELAGLYLPLTHSQAYYVESDQKISSLIDILAELFPKARFVWLIRKPRPVVTSTFSRGMFDDIEFFGQPKDTEGKKLFTGGEYSRYRLNGSRIKNELTPEQWRRMSAFERNCWYWKYVNETIENNVKTMPAERWALIRLEFFGEDLDAMLRKFRITSPAGFEFELQKTNTAKYELQSTWTDEQEAIFQGYTRELYLRVYQSIPPPA